MESKKKHAVLLISIFVLSVVVGFAAPAAGAADFVTGAALEWTLDTQLPDKVEAGEEFTVMLTFRNIGDINLTGNKRTTIELSSEGEDVGRIKMEDLRVNQTQPLSFKVKLKGDGNFALKLNAYNGGIVALYDENSQRTFDIGTVKVETIEEPINWIPIIAIIAVVGVVVGIFYMMNQKKKKAEEEKRLADEARRQEMIRKKEEEIAKKIEVRQVVGKETRDFYMLQRTKYGNLKPSGLTRSGLTILKKAKTKAELEAERIVCPKCGTDLKEVGDACPRCTASEKVEAVRHDIRTYKSQEDADFSDAEALLRKAEHRLNWSDFSMAYDLVSQAETRMKEIWDATEKGEAVESTVVEYSEAEGPSLESKVIGLEGEDAAVTASFSAGADTQAADNGEPEGEACDECGNTMVDEDCLFCTFDENMDATWAIIEKAELDGAKMDEVKSLCRQAKSAKERDNDDLAIRYLRRAKRMAGETYYAHGRSKTEGIIEYTNTLIMQVKGMGEDMTMAEQMIVKAKEAMEANEFEAARSMAAKADGYLKQMKEDSYRKRIAELMPTVEAGAGSNPDVDKLLGKAKKLIDAGELEGASDLLEAANDRL
jgi:predicted amidophosphoribosyltransferase